MNIQLPDDAHKRAKSEERDLCSWERRHDATGSYMCAWHSAKACSSGLASPNSPASRSLIAWKRHRELHNDTFGMIAARVLPRSATGIRTLPPILLVGNRRFARNKKARYASHGLRFAINLPDEELDAFRKRINKAAREDETAERHESDISGP